MVTALRAPDTNSRCQLWRAWRFHWLHRWLSVFASPSPRTRARPRARPRSARQERQPEDADEVGVAGLWTPSRVLVAHELVEGDGAEPVIGRRLHAGVIGDVTPHPHHEVLIVALVEEEEVAGL